MSLTAQERILAAVELNPDRPRVTLRRDDVRHLLADNQRLAADVEHYKTACVRLEQMCAHHCATIRDLQASAGQLRQDLERQRAEARLLIHPLAHLPHAWMLYGLTAFAGALAGHG